MNNIDIWYFLNKRLTFGLFGAIMYITNKVKGKKMKAQEVIVYIFFFVLFFFVAMTYEDNRIAEKQKLANQQERMAEEQLQLHAIDWYLNYR